jgi:hypothetical protein
MIRMAIEDEWRTGGFVERQATGTFARLCGREKFGKVGVRTVTLSQFSGRPGTGIATKMRCFGIAKVQAKTSAGTLNAEPEF